MVSRASWSVQHTRNHHGSNEALRGQVDITPEDFVIIPYLLNNYDTIRHAEEYDDNKGNRVVEITKRINGVAIVATIEKGKNNQAFVTLWKKATPAPMSQDNLSPELNVQDDGGLLLKVKRDIEKIKSLALKSSKIVGENGEPLVVYHGTENGGFTVFDKGYIRSEEGFWFTDSKEQADEYSESWEEEGSKGEDSQTYASFPRK